MQPLITQETLDLLKAAYGQPKAGDPLNKAITQATGLVWFDLRAPALSLIPVLTPIRNRIPRVAGEGGTAIHWKAITAINTGNLGGYASEGNRGGVQGITVADYLASYVGIGLEDYVTFEADYAGKNFEDVKATAALNLLRSTMIAEEKILLGGNSSMAIGAAATPTTSTANSGGSIADGASVGVACVPLTYEGYQLVGANGIADAVSFNRADTGSDTYNGGHGTPSAIAVQTAASASNHNTVSASVPVVRGAVAYAWYVGSDGSTGATTRFYGVTTINSVVITSIPLTPKQLLSALTASDLSQNAMAFDGLLTFAMKPSVGGYWAAQATGTPGTGTPLTSDAAGGISEIETVFKSLWDTYRLGPDRISVSSQEILNLTKKIIGNNGAPFLRLTQAAGVAANVVGGNVVEGILNKYTNRMVPFEVHPYAVPGTMLFEADTVPYPMSNVANVKEVVTRRDYYQLEWPLRSRKYEYGVYADEVLRVKVPFTLAALSNIANG